MMNGWHGGGGSVSWFGLALLMLMFWGFIVAVVIVAVRWPVRRQPDDSASSTPPRDPSLRILDERFARGEIDADEYRQRRDVLRSP